MKRKFYLDIAASGQRMPIGTDLVLHEKANPEEIRKNGLELGKVIEEAALRYGTPLAVPLMDLRLEKLDLLRRLDVAEEDISAFHFHEAPGDDVLERAEATANAPFGPENQAHFDAVRYIAEETDLLPVGMSIGPFSLMTKLVSDPIVPVAMAGMGLTGDEDPGVKLAERCLQLAEKTIARSVEAQIRAGARAIIVCEPAANVVYISPKMLDSGSDIFERYVIQPNLRMKRQMAEAGVDLIFHDCGELTDGMVEEFGKRLHPVMLTLGGSRVLWEDARLLPKDVVLFGNLPSKNFYSDSKLPATEVERISRKLISKMDEAGHPFILGSECDVLHVPDARDTIRRKVDVMMNCSCTEESVA